MALTARLTAALCTSTSSSDACTIRLAGSPSALRVPRSNSARLGTSFASGAPLLIPRVSLQRRVRAAAFSIRSEQNSQGSGLDVWLGRLGMIGFATAISIEIATGKGLLENFGLTSPLPTVALAVTGLVGVLTAIFIFQSASDN